MDYSRISRFVNEQLDALEKGRCQRPDLYKALEGAGYAISGRARKIREAADSFGYMVYDGCPGRSKIFNPQVVFVTDQHGFFDEAIAGMFSKFASQKVLGMEHVIAVEGGNGRLVRDKSELQNDGSLVYTIEDAIGQKKFIAEKGGYLARLFPLIKKNGLFVDFSDNLEEAKRFVENYLKFNEARMNLFRTGINPKTSEELRTRLNEYYEPLFKRSERFLNNHLYYTGQKFDTFQIYGIVDHLLGSVQRGLTNNRISYVGFVPRKISQDTGIEHMRKLFLALASRR